MRTVASGLRMPNGVAFRNGSLPDDELNRAPAAGLHFGFPCCHAGNLPDPEFGSLRRCAQFVAPEARLGAHVAALGMRFLRGSSFPVDCQESIMIAEHGSWNRSAPVGCRLVRVRVGGGRAGGAEVFADGWLQGATAWGRPVDVEVLPDGSLLVSDDRAGAICRITYDSR